MLDDRLSGISEYLESLYAKYERPDLISPDPLQFVKFDDVLDREISALIASSLAYGRVAMILRSVGFVLSKLGTSPRKAVESGNLSGWQTQFRGFKHRFTDGDDIAYLLNGIQHVLNEFGTMEQCIIHYRKKTGNLIGGLDGLVRELSQGRKNTLLTLPSKGSACKRHFLMLRWLVRNDSVDPGGWDGLSPSELIIPLDVHMYQICSSLGFTHRKSADLKTAMEITSVFSAMCPEDPVRYDFVLTRFGIRDDMRQSELIDNCKQVKGVL